jgi:hypothetical protein
MARILARSLEFVGAFFHGQLVGKTPAGGVNGAVYRTAVVILAAAILPFSC